jgi:hypothetical protein
VKTTHLGNRLIRLVKHRWFDEHRVRRALDSAALGRIEAEVTASERRHGGEIRVCVEAGLPWSYLWKRLSARDRAITLFGKLRVWDTERNSGVLIYLLVAERAIEIVADRGLNAHVSAAQWQAVVERMREPLRAGLLEAGLKAAIAAVDELLQRQFPLAEGEANPDELPNRPWVG